MAEGGSDGASWRTTTGDRAVATIRYAAATEPRRGSSANQDALVIQPPVFLVADGMGGHRDGGAASGAVADEFQRLARSPGITVEQVRDCLARCEVRVEALADGAGPAPGSTLVALVLVEQDDVPYWLMVNLGDSRVYRLFEGTLDQLSHDHSVVQELIDAGEIREDDARTHPERNVITRAIGVEAPEGGADYSLIPVVGRSVLVLCSDGVSSELDSERIRSIVDGAPSPAECARHLVAAAMAEGGRDDATAVVVEVVSVGDVTEDGPGAPTPAEVDTVPGGAGR